MISNQILQRTIDGLAQITDREFCVFDTEGNVLASDIEDAASLSGAAVKLATSGSEKRKSGGCTFYKVFDGDGLRYIAAVNGDDDASSMVGRILCQEIQELAVAYRDRFDRESFIKNLLLDNMLLVDVYNRAKKLHVDIEARRVVMVVEIGEDKSGDELDRVRSVFGTHAPDFVTVVDEKSIIVVKHLGDGGYDDVEKTAKVILDAFRDYKKSDVRIAYGTIVGEIREVSRSYKEAMMALDVGKIFFKDRDIIAYSVLGIGRLIYQLPLPLCRMFINEIFGDKKPDQFDEETLTTINKFFENSLNVSETSRQLFIHRNTLVYRLDKLQKSTGLDLRVFEDAITFKIALMVVKYMKYMESTDKWVRAFSMQSYRQVFIKFSMIDFKLISTFGYISLFLF